MGLGFFPIAVWQLPWPKRCESFNNMKYQIRVDLMELALDLRVRSF